MNASLDIRKTYKLYIEGKFFDQYQKIIKTKGTKIKKYLHI